MAEDVDLQGCEACGTEHPIEDMHMMEDCWFCTKCTEEWRAGFAVCDHTWEPHVSTMGDEGQYCTKCAGFVANEDFASLGLTPPPESQRRGEQAA